MSRGKANSDDSYYFPKKLAMEKSFFPFEIRQTADRPHVKLLIFQWRVFNDFTLINITNILGSISETSEILLKQQHDFISKPKHTTEISTIVQYGSNTYDSYLSQVLFK